MEKKYYMVLFALLAIAQLGVAARMIIQQEQIIQKGEPFFFKTAPIDPYDPFRGKYITLRFEAEQYETTDLRTWQAQEEVFVSIITDSAGFVQIAGLSKTPPLSDTPYFQARVNYFYPTDSLATISLDFPFDRFYMEESKAPEAEKIYREAFQQSKEDIYAVVFINQGKSVLEDVKIGEQSIKDLSTKKIRE